MYSEISGGEQMSWMGKMMCWVQFMLILAIFIMVIVMVSKEGFENLPDYGIGQRRDVIAAVPAYEEESMQQKVDRWSKQPEKQEVSQLTGSRDFPVFFQDYNVEAVRKGNSAVASAREGFEGGKSDDDLSRALGGH